MTKANPAPDANGAFRKCKDCPELTSRKVRLRAAPHPGPRCATHHRDEVKRQKAAAHDTRVQRLYGLGAGEYAELLAFQGGRCALCRRATGKSKALAVDHDHSTGLVRAALCGPCNKLIGYARDSTEFFQRFIDYLNEPPAMRLWGPDHGRKAPDGR